MTNRYKDSEIPIAHIDKLRAKKAIIGLDAGHGWDTSGKQSDIKDSFGRTLLKENEFNRSIVDRLCMLFDLHGIESKIINQNWYDLSLSDRVLTSHSCSHYISIHADYSEHRVASGITIFHAPNSKIGRFIAVNTYTNLSDELKFGNRSSPIQSARFKVLIQTPMPAILIESGFMSNSDDLRRLRSSTWRNAYAWNLFCSLCVSISKSYEN
jgi:N-acetylmuramoyl-L-alanine amidase